MKLVESKVLGVMNMALLKYRVMLTQLLVCVLQQILDRFQNLILLDFLGKITWIIDLNRQSGEVLAFDFISKAREIVSIKLINILLIGSHFSNLPFQFTFQSFDFSLCLVCELFNLECLFPLWNLNNIFI